MMRYRAYCDSDCFYDTLDPQLIITSPKVDLEVSKAGTFTFTVRTDNPFCNQLKKLKPIITLYQNEKLIFRGRIIDDDIGFYNDKNVICEGELAFFNDTVQRPYDFLTGTGSGSSVRGMLDYFITRHNEQVESNKQFRIGTVTVVGRNNDDYILRKSGEYRKTWEAINEKLINQLGGFLQVRHVGNISYIDYLASTDKFCRQPIKFGENLIDLKHASYGHEIATAIIPLGDPLVITDGEGNEEESDQRLTIADINHGVDYVYNQNAVNKYGWIFKPVEFDGVKDPEKLLQLGNAELEKTILFNGSLELTAADLAGTGADIESFEIGTYVNAVSEPHDIDSDFFIKKLSLDLANPANNTVTLDYTFKSLTELELSNKNEIRNDYIERIEETRNNVEKGVVKKVQALYSYVDQLPDSIVSTVGESFYNKDDVDDIISKQQTKFTQTKNMFEFMFDALGNQVIDEGEIRSEGFRKIQKYIRFENGNIILGQIGEPVELRLERNVIHFLCDGAEVMYIKDRSLYIEDGEFVKRLKINKWEFVEEENGSLSFKKVG